MANVFLRWWFSSVELGKGDDDDDDYDGEIVVESRWISLQINFLYEVISELVATWIFTLCCFLHSVYLGCIWKSYFFCQSDYLNLTI